MKNGSHKLAKNERADRQGDRRGKVIQFDKLKE